MCFIFLVLIVEEGWVIVLLHVSLRGLVGIHLSHGLFGLTCLLFGGHFLFLLLFFVHLDLLEFIENVLVVQESVRKLVHKCSSCQESIDSPFNDRHLQKLVDGGSLSGISLEHHRDNVGDSRTEMGWKGCILALDNLLSQLMKGASVERRGQGSHLVQENTEGPDV